jgi:outer membrane usher protein FimD/PapC
LLTALPVRADDDGTPLFRLIGTAPAGFEMLAAAQTALIDVYYGDRPLLSTMATFTADEITFDRPDDVLAAIPDLLNPELVRPLLTGPLEPNSKLICGAPVRQSCGNLQPEVAGVIFDADRYRLDLFVASEQRTRGEPPKRKFLAASESDFSFVQNFAGNFAGTSRGSDGVTVSSFSTVAYRENRIVGIASYSDTNDLTVDRLFARRDFEGMQYVGGLFRTSGRTPTFAGENDLLGVRMASSLETRMDLNQSRGTPIDLFLSSRARVDIVKDGRLLSTRFYDPGNQILDTTMLPEGAYDITIRITENGVVREETQFFTKTARVPPKDQSLFTLEAGQVMRRDTTELFPEDTGAFLVRGGYSNRLTDHFGIDAGVAGTSEDQMLETGIFLIDTLPGTRSAFYEFQATAFGSAEGDYGYGFNGFMRWGRFSVNFDLRDVNKKNDPLPEFEDEFRLIPDDLEQASLSMQIPLGRGTMGISASDNRRSDTEKRETQSVNVRYPLLRTRLGMLEFRGDVSRTNGDYAAFVGVRFNFWRDKWSGDIAPSYQYADKGLSIDDGFRVDGSTSWHDPNSQIGDVRLTALGSVGGKSDRVGSTMDWQHFLGRTLASVDHVNRDGEGTTNYGLTFNTSMLTDGESWTFGGQNTTNSAVVIDLEGEAPETDFEVLINGFRRGYAPAGRSTAIHLAPFRSYEVRISPRRSNFVSFKDRIEEVTLYPGNVTRLTWEIADLLVVVGLVRDPDGNPVADAVVENAVGLASTDQNGYFQAEVRRPKSTNGVLLDFRDSEGLCRVLVPEFEERVGVGFLDTLTCRRVEEP